MRKRELLLLAALLLLLSLWKYLRPERAEAVRAWTEEALFPETRETVEAWGRLFAEREEPVAALRPGAAP